MRKVLFSSDRPLERAENLKCVWDAYRGPKEFVQYLVDACRALSDRYSVFVTDEIPQYSPTKGNVRTVFVSHGISGDKLYGLDCSESHRAGASQVDYAICTTEYSRRRVMAQLGLPEERVLPLGMPITDRYSGKRKGDGSTFLAEYGRAYLYVPTWRAPGNPPLPRVDWRKVDSLLGDDEVLAVKRHMCTADPIVGEELRHVSEVGNMAPSAPYLIDCDVVSTDFSSIMFDGYVLGRPNVLVTDGHAAYQASHGMYESYPGWYSSRAVEAQGNEEAFVAALRDAFGKGLGSVERNVVDTVTGECDGHSAERVAELIAKLA
jgi:CDP-glycerol glycerophosphotransferase (TagB/SpsB family)